jgi:hypothetical protein
MAANSKRQDLREVALKAFSVRGDLCAAFDAAIDATVEEAALVVGSMFPGSELGSRLPGMVRERIRSRLDEEPGDAEAG